MRINRLVDKYICGKRSEIDAICDGTDVLFRNHGTVEEQVYCDSIECISSFSISQKVKDTILEYAKLGIGIGMLDF